MDLKLGSIKPLGFSTEPFQGFDEGHLKHLYHSKLTMVIFVYH